MYMFQTKTTKNGHVCTFFLLKYIELHTNIESTTVTEPHAALDAS